jgi:hypothetical protein
MVYDTRQPTAATAGCARASAAAPVVASTTAASAAAGLSARIRA